MSSSGWDDKWLSQLQSPRRNRYFDGKLMDEDSFTMEQQYTLAEHRLLNRLVLGPGVICGLGVSPIQSESNHGLRISAGLAIDGWGRRIVVPEDVDLCPVEVTDDERDGQPAKRDALPENLVVSLCYRERQADFTTAVLPDPVRDSTAGGEAATWVESYAVRVRAGTADDIAHPGEPELNAMLQEGRLHDALCALTAATAALPDDPSLVLANVTASPDGSFSVTECAPRPVVPTNQVLLQLIACLAARVQECCDGSRDPLLGGKGLRKGHGHGGHRDHGQGNH
ncbi:MAG TPA: hypothetical protein VKG85_11935 [Actinomycetes bacterium]|nr:hypothetical protein [Actinomycetes bacterium]